MTRRTAPSRWRLACALALTSAIGASSHSATSAQETAPVPLGVQASRLADIDGTLFFMGLDPDLGFEVFVSDGSPAGTGLLHDIQGSEFDVVSSFPERFTSLNGGAFFVAVQGDWDGASGTVGIGQEFWWSNGTPAGLVGFDIFPGPVAGNPLGTSIVELGGVAYFWADHPDHGIEVWRSDGTPGGTFLMKDINPGPADGYGETTWLFAVNGLLYFFADDGVSGAELWKSDGTAAGTVRVADVNPGPGGSEVAASRVVAAGGLLYFVATDGSTIQLWTTDGTPEGTAPLGFAFHGIPTNLTDFNGTLVFTVLFNSSFDLWKTDGTAAGTMRINLAPWSPAELTVVGDTLFFRAGSDAASLDVELWKSDGTEAGTARVKDINPGVAPSNPGQLVDVAGTLYFRADDGTHGSELWRSDGTEAGTELAYDVEPGALGSVPNELTVSGQNLFFTIAQANPVSFPPGTLMALALSGPPEAEAPIVTPNLDGPLGTNGWYVGDVSVTWTIDDRGFPLTSSSGCGPQTVVTDTAGLTVTCSATNAGGTTTESVLIGRDTTPPVATAVRVPPEPASGWHNSDVLVVWTGSDATSGIGSCTDAETIATEGAGQSSGPGTCTDNAGLTSAPVSLTGISIDKTPPPLPTVTPSSQNNEFGWYNTDVTATWTGTDALSGIAGCTPPQTISTEGQDQATVLGTCTDVAGNVSQGIQIFGINIDRTPPTADVQAPRGVFPRRSLVFVNYSCADALSGVLSCVGEQPNGELLDTSKRVKKGSFTVVVTDKAGNQATVTMPYEISPK